MTTLSHADSEAEIRSYRTAFGVSAGVWAQRLHHVQDAYWIASAGSLLPDYNLALVHDQPAAELTTLVIDTVLASKDPTLVMLAGAGLGGAQTLADANWVCLRTLPLMMLSNNGAPDRAVRQLVPADLPRAREIAAAAFAVPEELAATIYSATVMNDENALFTGLFDEGQLVSTFVTCRNGSVITGWAMATDPARMRRGLAARLMGATVHLAAQQHGPTVLLGLATDAGRHTYEQIGTRVIEHWQIWSRPRWVFAG
ncbi:hypothetical protein FOS14_08240 [Skermania sp. ID1734]|uniref:hypothetical protein n=1 Tax=Skermania sp. ID1734 TaxID=2597516 RepID=UPI00117D5CE8|nr:hypothetical protein [Skermania sp. ID1734]TSE00397.1 hypothetical protein FOS14_08240 [Skermania sp. ID1734]